MYYGQFPPTSRLKLRFVLFKAERVSGAAGISNPCRAGNCLSFEKDKPQF